MKHNALFPFLLAGAAMLIAGCGKSAEFKKLESDLFASVTAMHDDGMSLMNKGRDLSAKIDDAIAMYDSMAAKYPKEFEGHSNDDLKAAKEKLAGAAASMKDWMSGMKPYDPTMDHTEVMAQLTKAKDGITKVKGDFQEAISSATTALENHKAFAEEMAAKLAKTVKKVAKR
jgi:hypothetical protein